MLEIAWEGGHRSLYRGETLRWACPCASCRGEAGEPGKLDLEPQLAGDELELTEVALVGQYALQLGFASGHSTGIYSFRYLRRLCDCAECANTQKAD